ncbi:beta-glucosidase 24-like [Mercurialis annua]|uniref:beta-glucosidase 24-like n=1 Tax=Mercurialis annua TaxID=3986 RepID=UPI00215F96A1|nr:beta-glucosidase 24-like [Mercurialis annua]
MEIRSSPLLLAMLILFITNSFHSTESIKDSSPVPIIKFDSSYFPAGFYFGSATSSYQTEGEARKKGRGTSIWDTLAHDFPERIVDGSNGDVAVDFYNQYKDDISKMSKIVGMNAFRFSISWSRIIPSGRIRDGINEEGIAFYNKIIDEAVINGLEPFVTLFHWDLPQVLEDKYGGFRSQDIVSDYEDYAELCFQRFGDRVKHWITMNEPYIFTIHGYDTGIMAPGRCSYWVNRACLAGDSATEPYIVGHHMLLAHAAAVHIYRKMGQNGKIGITLDVSWPMPLTNSVADSEAAQRELDYAYGWFMDPLTYGQYPRIMQNEITGNRLPNFTMRQSQLLKGSYDFVGLNYYYSNYASDNYTANPNPDHIRYMTDSGVNLTRYGIFPDGLRYLLNYTKDTYRNPLIYITETGLSDEKGLPQEEALKDIWRIKYFKTHLWNVLRSICDYNVNVQGFFAWSFMDNYEWSNGYTLRYGLYAIDRTNKTLPRLPKLSVAWFQQFLKDKSSSGEPKCDIMPQINDSSSSEDMEEL